MSNRSQKVSKKRRRSVIEPDDDDTKEDVKIKTELKASRWISPSQLQSQFQLQSQLLSQASPRSQRYTGPVPSGVIDANNNRTPEFGCGAIKSIKLFNFVTFDDVSLECSPGLYLIMSSNGTGKSSIVCAILLGLGGNTSLLGRGEVVSDFIKRGQEEAIIEIALHNGIKDRIHKGVHQDAAIRRAFCKNRTTWRLNNKIIEKSDIVDIIVGLNNKVNNF